MASGCMETMMAGSNYWNGASVTKVWDGVWRDVLPWLATWTKYDDGREDSNHKSRVGDMSWRTCHNKLEKGRVYIPLGI